MYGGSHRSTRNIHFGRRPKRRVPVKFVLFVIVVIALAAAAVVARAETLSVPPLTVQRVLPASATFPGPAPRLAWPAQGEAAVEVQGLPPLGSHGSSHPLPIASVAKVMTAYVILRDHPLQPGQAGFAVTIGAGDVTDYQARLSRSESVVPVAAGETISESQLLQALLVASGNNIAVILADHDAGSVPAFVAKMNSTARTLGMTHTTYTDPSGLEASTVSDASDQLALAARAMAIPVFAHIVSMTSVDLPVAGRLTNFDTSVGHDGYVGIKTGSDTTAGGCLVFASRQTVAGHPVTVLGAVIGQDPGEPSTPVLIRAAVDASTALVHSVVASVSMRTLVPPGTPAAVVTDAQGHRVVATTAGPLQAMGFGGLTVPVRLTARRVGHSLRAGDTVAAVVIGSPDQTTAGTASPASTGASTVATAGSGMPPVGFGWRLLHAV